MIVWPRFLSTVKGGNYNLKLKSYLQSYNFYKTYLNQPILLGRYLHDTQTGIILKLVKGAVGYVAFSILIKLSVSLYRAARIGCLSQL